MLDDRIGGDAEVDWVVEAERGAVLTVDPMAGHAILAVEGVEVGELVGPDLGFVRARGADQQPVAAGKE